MSGALNFLLKCVAQKKTVSGRGRGAKGIGMGGAKRHKKVVRDSIRGITKQALRRLARRGGVKRISGMVYDEARSMLPHPQFCEHLCHQW